MIGYLCVWSSGSFHPLLTGAAYSTVLAWIQSKGGSGLFRLKSGQHKPFSSWELFGTILPQLPHKQLNSIAFVFACVKHWHFTELSLSAASKQPTVENGWIWLVSMQWRIQIPFSRHFFFFLKHSCHLDYPAFHTFWFCTQGKSQQQVKMKRKREWVWLLVISIEKKKKVRVRVNKKEEGRWQLLNVTFQTWFTGLNEHTALT